MKTRESLFKFIAWLTAKHITHYRAVTQLLSNIGVFLMRIVHPEMFDHAQSVLHQTQTLREIHILKACFEMKRAVAQEGGWKRHHARNLDQIASILVNTFDWDPDDFGEFVEELTEGVFSLVGSDDDDDDD